MSTYDLPSSFSNFRTVRLIYTRLSSPNFINSKIFIQESMKTNRQENMGTLNCTIGLRGGILMIIYVTEAQYSSGQPV